MSDLLVILNPRDIPECMSALRDLEIDKLWIRRLTESQIADNWPEILRRAAGYDRLILQSDDGIVRPHALQAVRDAMDDHPVVTGYSNLSVTDYRVNLSKEPIDEDHPHPDAYTFYTLTEIMESQQPLIPTYVVGFALTGMPYEMWERYPFEVFNDYPGNASDYMLSRRLQQDSVPMLAHRDAFVWHGKQVWNTGDTANHRRLLLHEEPEVVLDAMVMA